MPQLVTYAALILLYIAREIRSGNATCIDCNDKGLTSELSSLSTSKNQSLHGRCSSPCQCPLVLPRCQDGVSMIRDGCGCCLTCARQQGDVCDNVQLCDERRQLGCSFSNQSSSSGICRVRKGQSCQVNGVLHKDGETFKLDCRTQCTCQNGTYGCVSLCPHENVRPSPRCRNPQLVRIHGSCCREWLCETNRWEDRKLKCKQLVKDWSPCSVTCGVGISFRISNDNPECELRNETRICQIRPCEVAKEQVELTSRGHHVRKHHLCRATIRSALPVRLSDGANCTSVDLFQPKFCGFCPTHHCCNPYISTTKKIQFHCYEEDDDAYTLMQKDVLWILKCNCTSTC